MLLPRPNDMGIYSRQRFAESFNVRSMRQPCE